MGNRSVMKTVVLSIGAVLLGLVAGFAVAVAVNPDCWVARRHEILVATADIPSGCAITLNQLASKSVPENFIPPNAIDAANNWLLDGIKAKNRIPKDGYILYGDIDLEPVSLMTENRRENQPL